MSDLKNELASLRIEHRAPTRSPWRWPLLLLIPAVLALLIVYGLRARQALTAPEVSTVTVGLSGGSAAPTGGAAVLTASGYVVARRKAVVSAKIQGRLAVLRVEEGSRVREGETIARLESTDYEAQVRRSAAAVQVAEAQLAEQQRQLRLAQDLAGQQVLSRDQLEATDSRVRTSQASLAQAKAEHGFAQAQLDNTIIRAPFTGVVVRKMAEVGESVAPIPPGVNLSTSSGAIVALADLETLEVESDVAEANVARLADEQPAEVTVEAFPDRKYKAVLRQVIPTADRTKATVQVKVTILDKDKDLKPEMSARVVFVEPPEKRVEGAPPPKPVVTVPSEAVVTRNGKQLVFEVREGKVRERSIVVGPERQGQFVVREGLSGGETLVVRPPQTLKEGDAVRVKAEGKNS
ncbi:MAG TPA: efflux RND transporter periplasmic adaptor subunit [Vicinamibacteria bacterium]